MNNPEIFNIYIEKLVQNVTELTKTNILMSAQITFYERQITALTEKINSLEEALDKASSKAAKRAEKENSF